MQNTAGGTIGGLGGGGGGGLGMNDLSRAGGGGAGAGLARFRSAPASWIDALLDDDDSLKLSSPHNSGGLTQLLTSGTGTGTTTTGPASGPLTGPGPGPLARASSGFNQTGLDPGFFEGGGGGGGGGGGAQQNANFHRMNSSPADFLSGNVDGYFSNYGIPSSYDYVGSSVDLSPSAKRMREADSDQSSPSFSRRGEQSGQLSATSSLLDMDMEKLLEDSVPCRTRAKRGCATHPRSIAERVRRTRISDRIRKLQELVPNMDKQTNTADMLEEAVEYVRTLQKQINDLTEQQKKCKCMAKS